MSSTSRISSLVRKQEAWFFIYELYGALSLCPTFNLSNTQCLVAPTYYVNADVLRKALKLVDDHHSPPCQIQGDMMEKTQLQDSSMLWNKF